MDIVIILSEKDSISITTTFNCAKLCNCPTNAVMLFFKYGIPITPIYKARRKTAVTLCCNIYPTQEIDQITIGKNVIVGAGAVVIRDVPVDVTVVGNPAGIISRK